MPPAKRRFGLLGSLDRSNVAAAIVAALVAIWAFFHLLSLPDPFVGHGHYILNKPLDNQYLPYRMGRGHPLEECSTTEAVKDQIMARFGKDIASVNQRLAPVLAQDGPLARMVSLTGKLRAILGIYQATSDELREFHETPCQGEWRPHNNFELIHKWFLTEAPYVWFMVEHGVTPLEVDVAMRLLQVMAVACLFLSMQRMARSNTAGLLSVVILANLTQWPSGDWYDTFLLAFPLVYLGQLLADPDLAAESSRAVRAVLVLLLSALFGVATVATWFSYPPQNRMVYLLMIGVVGLVALVRRKPALIVRLAVMWLAVKVVTFPIVGVGNMFAPVAGVNHVTNSGFAKMSAFIGQCERPNPYGLPLADLATVNDPLMFSPLLESMAPGFIMHQTEGYYGNFFLHDLILHHPVAFVETIWKRVFLHFAFPDKFVEIFWKDQRDWRYGLWWGAAVGLLLCPMLVVACGKGWTRCLPVVLAAWWSYMGVHVALFYFHSHDYYVRGGVFFMLCTLPGVAVFIAGKARCMLGLPTRAAAIVQGLKAMPRRLSLALAAGLLVVFVLASSYFVRESRKEVQAFNVIYPLIYGYLHSPEGTRPEELESSIEAIRALGHNGPGEAEMWGAQVFHAYRTWRYRVDNPPSGWIPHGMEQAQLPTYNARAQELVERYFRAALAAAPDNPYFPVYARRLEIPGWEEIFKRAVRQHPHAPYAAAMCKQLLFSAPLTPPDFAFIASTFVADVGAFLDETSNYRPGFVRSPNVLTALHSEAEIGPGGTRIRLEPGERAVLQGLAAWGSPEMRLAAYLKVSRGSVAWDVVTYEGAPCSSLRTSLGTGEAGAYVLCDLTPGAQTKTVHLVFMAGKDGADILVRDLYPVVLTPRLSRSSRPRPGDSPS